MNTFVIALFALVAAASSAAIENRPEPIAILSQTQEVNADGSFNSAFQTANGISRTESGVLINPGQKDEAEVIQGEASWTDPNGEPVSLKWVAGPDGVKFEGSHLPVAPEPQPIPEAIQRSLEWAAAHPYKEPVEAKSL